MSDKTILGKTIEIDGEIEGEEELVIQGRVQGKIRSERDVVVDDSGDVRATVSTRNLSVHGRLEGNVEASDCVKICAEGTMIGDIASPRVVLADGSKFKGLIDSSQGG